MSKRKNSGVCGAAKGFDGREIENVKKNLISSASGRLELAKRSSISNIMFQNLIESASLHNPELQRSNGIGPSGDDVAIVNESSVHFRAAFSKKCVVDMSFDFPEDDVVAWLVGQVGVAGEVN